MNATMLAAMFSAALCGQIAPNGGRDFALEQVVNEQAGFLVRVAVDKPDRVYREGETMTISLMAEKDCYLFLLFRNAEGKMSCLFPNEYEANNAVRGGVAVQIPPSKDSFRFRALAPFGMELLQVVAIKQSADIFAHRPLNRSGRATPLSTRDVAEAWAQIQQLPRDQWSEARIELTTVPASAPPQNTTGGRRWGVCIGISNYADAEIPKLSYSHLDAQRMAETLGKLYGPGNITLLQDAAATKEAIRRAIYDDLAAKSRPGDLVMIYFSGHGGRCADTSGDEEDGLDEYLVPVEGRVADPESMILDDTLARWIQQLDGRQVVLVLDACYSGGANRGKNAKGLSRANARTGRLDFLDGELRRTKDLGQKGTAVLAASEANQLAWELQDADGSVLTRFLLDAINDPKADLNGDGRLTLTEAYQFVAPKVNAYVEMTYFTKQTPVLIDNAGSEILLRP